MSDTSQGNGWWMASDGKWYPPQSAPPPPAVYVQAPKKGPRWGCIIPIGVVGLVIVLLVVIIAVAVGGGKNSTTGGGNKNPAGCTAHPATYPDHQSTDCVALPNGTVSIANTTVSATWTTSTDDFGSASICAAVKIVNHNSTTISYNDLYWSLQNPAGTVVNTNFSATGDLGSGELVAGGTATGNVCFDNPGTAGTYVGIYKPDAFNSTRGIWLTALN